MTRTVGLVDTTLRDGHQSLWALGMRTEDMLPALSVIDDSGFDGIEFWVPLVQIYKSVRELNQNPLQWLRLGAAQASSGNLRLHGGWDTAFRFVPKAVVELLLRTVVAAGVHVTRCSEPWNDFKSLEPQLRELERVGIAPVVNLTYSVSPKHTDDYYRGVVEELVASRPSRICFKDVGGLLTPDRARDLLPLIREETAGIPLEMHAHCTNSMADYNYVIAAESGFDSLHTALPPLCDGSSLPSMFTTIDNLRAAGFDCPVSPEPLRDVEEHFRQVGSSRGLPSGSKTKYGVAQYQHQVPGGMISNFRHQLRLTGQEKMLGEVLRECGRVREDLGYPIMITPLSQFVGTQAVLNVQSGGRYDVLADTTIEYCLGWWGEQATTDMDQDLRSQILGTSRAQELQERGRRRDDRTLEEIRSDNGDPTDDELILKAYAGAAPGDLLGNEPPIYKGLRVGGHPFESFLDADRATRYSAVDAKDGSTRLRILR